MLASESSALRASLAGVMREAGEIARATARGAFRHWTKGDSSPVSEADIAVNELLHNRLMALVPDAGWLSEETEQMPDSATPLVWVVDPIDGTRSYISGRADWSVSVALTDNGRPIVASVYVPVPDEMFLVSRDGGATLNGASIKVRDGVLSGAKLAGPAAISTVLQISRRAQFRSRRSIRSPFGWRALHRGNSTSDSRGPALMTGTLPQRTFWCTKPAACLATLPAGRRYTTTIHTLYRPRLLRPDRCGIAH